MSDSLQVMEEIAFILVLQNEEMSDCPEETGVREKSTRFQMLITPHSVTHTIVTGTE